METFATKNITKINRYKKNPDCTSTTEHKTDINITKIDKYKKKLNSNSTTEPKTEHNYTLVNQAINIYQSKKGVTNEIEYINNNNKKAIL